MTALEQLSSWGTDPDIDVFISAEIVGGSSSAMRVRGAELLGKIGMVAIHPTNVLSIETVRGVRFVSIVGNAGSHTHRIVIVPTSLFATDRQAN